MNEDDFQQALALVAQQRVERERACMADIGEALKQHNCALSLTAPGVDENVLKALEIAMRFTIIVKAL